MGCQIKVIKDRFHKRIKVPMYIRQVPTVLPVFIFSNTVSLHCLLNKKKKKSLRMITGYFQSLLDVGGQTYLSLIPNPILLNLFFCFVLFPSHPLFVVNFSFPLVRGYYTPKRHSLLVTIPRIRSTSRLLFLSFYSLRIAQRNSSFISYFDIRFPRSIFMLNLHKKLDCSDIRKCNPNASLRHNGKLTLHLFDHVCTLAHVLDMYSPKQNDILHAGLLM